MVVVALAGPAAEEGETMATMTHLHHTPLVCQSRNQSTAPTVNKLLAKAPSRGDLASGLVLPLALLQAMPQMPGKIGTTEVGDHIEAPNIRTRK